ncbi:MAG: glycine dehydrogenase, partial [Deltaproteobacteria bacterium]|nr:glycine dehydrogenase [Deltaproteobacteria bacterium]
MPHTPDEISQMLGEIGAKDLDQLFSSIPPDLQFKKPLNLPPALSEMELRAELLKISKKNTSVRDSVSFLGGGAYHHYLPSAISQLINRGEFFT